MGPLPYEGRFKQTGPKFTKANCFYKYSAFVDLRLADMISQEIIVYYKFTYTYVYYTVSLLYLRIVCWSYFSLTKWVQFD